MNYKEILTKEAVKQFKEEGATFAIITLYSRSTDDLEGSVIRDVEVDLEEGCFAIAGKTVLAKVAMAAHFIGHEIDGECWFPFGTLYKFVKDEDRLIAEIAAVAGVDPLDLKWSFINEH